DRARSWRRPGAHLELDDRRRAVLGDVRERSDAPLLHQALALVVAEGVELAAVIVDLDDPGALGRGNAERDAGAGRFVERLQLAPVGGGAGAAAPAANDAALGGLGRGGRRPLRGRGGRLLPFRGSLFALRGRGGGGQRQRGRNRRCGDFHVFSLFTG